MNDSTKTLEEKNTEVFQCQICETNTLEWNAIEGRKAIFKCSKCGTYHYAHFIGDGLFPYTEEFIIARIE